MSQKQSFKAASAANQLEEDHKKAQLLKQLEQLGYHSSGRKQRSDKGQPRGSIAKPIEREPKNRLAIYMKVKNQMYNKDQRLQATGGYGTFLDMDENSFYLSIPARYQNKGHFYVQQYQGRTIEHNVRRQRIQKEIDLEKYRFEAYKEQAVLNPKEVVPSKYWPELRQMLIIRYDMTGDEATQALTKRQINWEDLFCEFYFLSHNDFWLWDYARWKMDYSFVPSQQLPEDFEFNYNASPGTEEFHPEWTYKANERREQEQQEAEQEKQRKADQFIWNMKKRSKLW